MVDAIDAFLVLKFSAALLRSLPCLDNGYVNRDSVIDALDAQLILQFAAGYPTELPPQ